MSIVNPLLFLIPEFVEEDLVVASEQLDTEEVAMSSKLLSSPNKGISISPCN